MKKHDTLFTKIQCQCISFWVEIQLVFERERKKPGDDGQTEDSDGLVSLFNGISTLFRLFNAKAILLEQQ